MLVSNVRRSPASTASFDRIKQYLRVDQSRLRFGGTVASGKKEYQTDSIYSLYYAQWLRVAWVLIAPKEPTTNPDILNSMLKRLGHALHPTGGEQARINEHTGRLTVGRLHFNRKAGWIIKERSPAVSINGTNRQFTLPEIPEESREVFQLTTLYLFPSWATAEAAAQKGAILPFPSMTVDLSAILA